MMLVVLGHAIQYTVGANCHSSHIWNIIYSFHMSAFMAVSGYVTFRPTESGGGHFIVRKHNKKTF